MLEGIDTTRSIDIFIRHGKSKYTNEPPDLTPEGLEEIKGIAHKLKPLYKHYKRIKHNSSPAVRAVGSLVTFTTENGDPFPSYSVIEDLRPVDIYRFPEFLAALSDPNYHKEYEAYLLKKEFDNPDPETRICERRSDIRERAIGYFISRINSQDYDSETEPTCNIHSTHFEIMSTLLSAFYGDVNNFPIEREEGPKNGEAIAIQKYSPREMVIYARSMSAKVAFSDWE